MNERTYIAIDLKSFYASVECIARGLDPMTANLVVADPTRTEKTICLAVSPALKAYGIPGRARLFEVVQRARDINRIRLNQAPGRSFTGRSSDSEELKNDPSLELSYIVAPPRMAKYMEISSRVYRTYLKYIAPEDIHVYSIDEVFMDVTDYLKIYGLSPRELCMKLIREVLAQTGITATAGIGTNLYLCKIAMDIVAKRMPADRDGVRIAELDEMSYRRMLWGHRPITDFWRVGRGYAARLEENGLYTMGDIARCSLGDRNTKYNEDLLYRLFGVNAELLIDHAWGWEPCGMPEIKAYKPEVNSLSSGQVLMGPYDFEKARLVVREMADQLALDMVAKGLVCDQVTLTVGYDIKNVDERSGKVFNGAVTDDWYGRRVPKPAHGSSNLGMFTSSAKKISEAVLNIYDRTVNSELSVRRMYIGANHVISEELAPAGPDDEQLDMFTDYGERETAREKEQAELDRERDAQEAILAIKEKFGKNAMFKGMDLEEGATARERNAQIGGHKA